MTLREIQYVHAVAHHGNMTKAAEALHITQPSLSQSIKSIEDQVGTRLFHRSKKGMTLTDQGQRFLHDSSQVLKAYEAFMASIHSYKDQAPKLGIGLFKLAHTSPVNNLVMTYLDLHGKDHYEMRVDAIEALESMIVNHQLDLALIKYSPLSKKNPKLKRTTLYRESLHVLMSIHNPLAQNKIIDPSDLKGNQLITSNKDEYPYAMTSKVMEDAGITLQTRTHTNYANLAMIMDLVEKDFGITFATEEVCAYYKRPGIVHRPLTVDYWYEVCLVEAQVSSHKESAKLLTFIQDKLAK